MQAGFVQVPTTGSSLGVSRGDSVWVALCVCVCVRLSVCSIPSLLFGLSLLLSGSAAQTFVSVAPNNLTLATTFWIEAYLSNRPEICAVMETATNLSVKSVAKWWGWIVTLSLTWKAHTFLGQTITCTDLFRFKQKCLCFPFTRKVLSNWLL